jgi:hypothetical protein
MDKTSPRQAKAVIFHSIVMPDQLLELYHEDTVSTVYLPADPRFNSTKYVFQYGERSDTLVLSYTNQSIVLSTDCGTYLYQKDLAIEHNTFGASAVIIKDSQLLLSIPVNIEIFL